MMERSIQPVVRKYYRLPAVHWLAIYLAAGFVCGACTMALCIAITKPEIRTQEIQAVTVDEFESKLAELFVLCQGVKP